MVRLMLVLAPVMCILSGVAVSSLLSTYVKDVNPTKAAEKKSKKVVDNDVELKRRVRFKRTTRYTVLLLSSSLLVSNSLPMFLFLALGVHIFRNRNDDYANVIRLSLHLGYIGSV